MHKIENRAAMMNNRRGLWDGGWGVKNTNGTLGNMETQKTEN